MTVLVMMAMRAEAAPIVDALGLMPFDRSMSTRGGPECHVGDDLVLAVNGPDPLHGVDSIGTTAAAICTMRAVDAFDPEWIVSAGTAGGFASRGGHVGQVILADGPIIHHDRRIRLAGFEEYGRGDYPTAPLSELAERLGFESGPCSTGDSLDAPPLDLAAMAEHGTVAKDMEAAAIANVAYRMSRSFTALKVITDLVDAPEPTPDQFLANLETASATLAEALPRLVVELHGYRRDRPS